MVRSFICICFSLLFLIHPVISFDCSNLVQANLCFELATQGCSWNGSSCSGTFSPSCVPPNCYYIYNSTTSTTQTGMPNDPLPTLTDGFLILNGSVGTLIVINPIQDTTIEMYTGFAPAEGSNITVKPLFNGNRYIIDFRKIQSVINAIWDLQKGSLKIISALIRDDYLPFRTSIYYLFGVNNTCTLTLERVDVMNLNLNLNRKKATLVYFAKLLATQASFYYNEGNINNSGILLSESRSSIAGRYFFKNVKFSNNTDFLGVAASDKSTEFHFENCRFSEGNITSGLFLPSQSQLSIINSTFENLLISNLIFSIDARSIHISNSIFRNLTLASNQTAAIVLQKDVQSISSLHVIEDCSFSDIAVSTTFILLDKFAVGLNMKNVSMSNFVLKAYDSSTFTASMYLDRVEWPGGLCCLAHGNAILQIESSSFVNISSHCLGLKNSQLSIKSTTFDNSLLNKPDDENPIISHDLVNNLYQDSGATWINLQGTSRTFTDGNEIILVGNTFIRNAKTPLYGGALRFGESFNGRAYIAFNEFIGNNAYYGGAIFSNSTFLTLYLSGNVFSENSAFDGGSLFKASLGTVNNNQSNASVILYNNTFNQNTAFRNGGGISLNWESLWAQDNSFISNQAVNGGGAIYFSNLDEDKNAKFGWLSNTSFVENSAKKLGGALKLSFDYALLNEDQDFPTIFRSNYDSKNQAVVGSNPSYYLLSFFDILIEETPDETFDTLKSWVNNHELTRVAFSINTSQEISGQEYIKHKSGNPLSQILRVQIFNDHHQPVDYINDGQISLQITKSQKTISNFSAFLVYSPIYFTFQNGEVYARSTLQMIGEPGTTATLQLKTIKTNSAFLINANSLQSYNFTVEFILCEIGDIFNSKSKTCDVCPSGSYSLDDPYRNSTICRQCPSKMTCLGGNKIAIEAGYWRYDTNKTNVVRCEENSICKGGLVDQVYHARGLCTFPNEGQMCNQCPSKYAKFGSSNVCVDCEKDVGYHIKAICFFVLQMIIIFYIFRLNETSTKQAINSQRLNLMKILVNFIQINSLIIQYNLNWPSFLLDPIKITNTIIPVGKDGFSIDCLIALNSSDHFNNQLIRLFITFFQPLIIWILIMLLNSLLKFKKRRMRKDIFTKEGINLSLIISFVVQPNIILNCLEMFRCQNLSDSKDPKYFMANNPSVECWTRTHLTWALGAVLPFFLIWGVILPLVVFIKAKKSFHTRKSFFFLYEGLKAKIWHWEFVLLLRKTSLILVFTVLKFTPLKVQVIISFTICLIMSLATLKLTPYLDPKLNRLESLCTYTLTFMAYAGSFSLSSNPNQTTSISFATIVLILNFTIYLSAVFYLIRSYLPTKTKFSPQGEMIPVKSLEIQSGLKILTSDIQLIFNSENDMFSMQKDDLNSPISQSANLDESSLNYDKFSPVLENSQKIDNFSVLKSSGSSDFSPRFSTKKLQSNPSHFFRESSIPSARDHLLMTSPRDTQTESPRNHDLMKRESNKSLPKKTIRTDSSVINLLKTDSQMATSHRETLIESPRDRPMLTSPRETLSEFPQDDLTKRESTKLLKKKTILKDSSVTNRVKAEKNKTLNTSN